MEYQSLPEHVDVYCDSDWAGEDTAKSTSGGTLLFGKHMWESWASTQQVIALSSGEAEFYSIGTATAKGLTVVHTLAEMKMIIGLRVHSDSSAGRGMCNRRGTGRVRHLQTRFLWLQEVLANNEFQLLRVGSNDNPADINTKFLNRDLIVKHMRRLSVGTLSGANWPVRGPASSQQLGTTILNMMGSPMTGR